MDKKWSEFNDRYFLEVMVFEEELIIAEVFEEDGWCFNSSLANVQDEYLGSDSLEHAKEEVELFLIGCLEDEIDYNEYLLKFIDDESESDEVNCCPMCGRR